MAEYIATLSSGDESAGFIDYGDDGHAGPEMAARDDLNADEVEIDAAAGEKLYGDTC